MWDNKELEKIIKCEFFPAKIEHCINHIINVLYSLHCYTKSPKSTVESWFNTLRGVQKWPRSTMDAIRGLMIAMYDNTIC